MGQISEADLHLSEAVSDLNYANPFLPDRLQREQQVLGSAFEPEPDTYWSLTPTQVAQRCPNLIRIIERARQTQNACVVNFQKAVAVIQKPFD